jgi:hypothetical protein
MTRSSDDYGWGPPPLTEEQEERAAVLEYEAGYSREEAEERAQNERPSNETSTISNTSKEIYTTFPHRNCDGITESNRLHVSEQGTPYLGQPVLEPAVAISDGIFFKRDSVTESNRLPVSEHTVTESGQSLSCYTRALGSSQAPHTSPPVATSEPAFELPLSREQEVRKILVEKIECPSELAEYLAPECLSACLQRGLDPIAVMEETAGAWRVARIEPGAPHISKVGTWIIKRISWWRDPQAPRVTASCAPPKLIKPDWAELRRRIIAGAVEGGEVRGADLRDYWDHQMAQGKLHALDAQISHAIAALERAGCCHRHGNALSITAEVLRIEPGTRHKLSRDQGMERLQRAVQRRWPAIGEQWQAIVDELLPGLRWWRSQLGEGLGGIADMVDARETDKEADEQVEYRARLRIGPSSRGLENGAALTDEELAELEAQKKRLAQVK